MGCLGECSKLLDEEKARRLSVEGRLTSIVGLCSIAATIVFGGHRPFVSIRMVGSGVVNVYAHSGSSGVLAPVFYQPTVFFGLGAPIQTTTSQDGRLTLVLPVGPFKLTAVNPFNGNKSFSCKIWLNAPRGLKDPVA